MPSTVNGIGTWYYGKKNIKLDSFCCESCGKDGVFKSYDTTLYFVFLFIPLIPLKKLRVLYECPACKRHRVISLKEWKRCKAQDLEEAFGKLNEFPGDEEKAEEAISVAASYQDYDAFLPVAEAAGKKFAESPKILCRLGCALLSLNKFEQAERLLKQSLKRKEDNDVREILADVLIRQGKTDEAAHFLKHIVRQEIPDRVGCLVQLVKAYQCQGEHGKALATLDECVLILPSIVDVKEFKALKKLSGKNLNSFKKIRNHAIPAVASGPGRAERDVSGFLAKLPGPLLLLAVFAVYLGCCIYQYSHQEMYLVSGLNRAYRFTLNGKEYTLQPFVRRRVPKPAGKLTLESAELKLKPETGDLSVSFFLSPFVNQVLILNPDGCAVFMRRKIFYATEAEQAPPSEEKVLAGRRWYRLSGLDYVFQEFPKRVSAEEDSVTVKRGLFAMSHFFYGLTASGYWAMLEEKLGRQKTVELATRMVKFSPDSLYPLVYLRDHLPAEEQIRIMRPLLAAKPVPVNLHRYYQDNMEELGKLRELEDEYRKMAEENSRDSDFQYLYARVVQDREKKLRLLSEGAAAHDPSPYCFYGLAYQAMRTGEFEKACEYSGRAVALDPENPLFQPVYRAARFAAGRYDELLAECRRNLERKGSDLPEVQYEMLLLCAQKKPDEAERQMKARFEAIRRDLSVQARERLRKFEDFNALACLYYGGRLAEYRKAAAGSKNPAIRFELAITEKNLPEAEKAFDALENPGLDDALLLYILAETGKAPEAAARHRVRVAQLLRESTGQEERRLAKFFDGGQPDLSEVLECDINRNKTEILVAVGLMHPALGKPCFELAEKLNYDLSFPHYFLGEVIDSQR